SRTFNELRPGKRKDRKAAAGNGRRGASQCESPGVSRRPAAPTAAAVLGVSAAIVPIATVRPFYSMFTPSRSIGVCLVGLCELRGRSAFGLAGFASFAVDRRLPWRALRASRSIGVWLGGLCELRGRLAIWLGVLCELRGRLAFGLAGFASF